MTVQFPYNLCKDCPILSPKEIEGDRKKCKHIM